MSLMKNVEEVLRNSKNTVFIGQQDSFGKNDHPLKSSLQIQGFIKLPKKILKIIKGQLSTTCGNSDIHEKKPIA